MNERLVKVAGDVQLTDEEIGIAVTQLNACKRYESAEIIFSFERGAMVQRGNITIRSTPGAAPTEPAIELGGRRLSTLPTSW